MVSDATKSHNFQQLFSIKNSQNHLHVLGNRIELKLRDG